MLVEILNRFSFGETPVIGVDSWPRSSQNHAANTAQTIHWGQSEIVRGSLGKDVATKKKSLYFSIDVQYSSK